MKSQTRMNRVPGFLAWLLMLGAMLTTSIASAADVELMSSGDKVTSLELTVGKSEVIRSTVPIREVMLGDPGVADFKMLTSQKMLILGKKSGRTNLVMRDRRGNVIAFFDVEVGYDVTGIKAKLHAVMPEEKGIEVRSSNHKVVMSGETTNLLAIDKALTLARTFVANDKDVINLMQVGGAQQVMLEVRIAEVARRSVKELGASTTVSGSVDGGYPLSLITTLASGVTSGASVNIGGTTDDVSVRLSALVTQSLAKILAEPNLVALSGNEAKFLSGGEFPVLVPQGDGVNTIEFKEFGVGVSFTPTVLSDRRINLKLAAESSEIDSSTEVAGYPGISTRRTATTVELGDGQGLAIAGLLQNNLNNAVNKFPGLGDVPVLGTLFRSTDFQRNETELVIVVVPRLVKPVSPDRLSVPTDDILPPNDMEQYFMGQLEGGKPSSKGGAGESQQPAGLEGPSGHQL